MRVVLFDDETMEALTVLHLSSWMLPRLRQSEPIVLPVFRNAPMRFDENVGDIQSIKNDCVRIWFEKFIRNGQEHWFCFTRDSEDALSLRSVFLPGQWPAVHEEYRRGMTDGIVRALEGVFRN